MSGRDIRDCSAQQMATISHLKKVIDGETFWHGSVCLTTQDLQQPNIGDDFINNKPVAISASSPRRARVYLVLSASLGTILDKRNMHLLDYTRAIALIGQEAEHYAQKDNPPIGTFAVVSRKEKSKRSMFFKAVSSSATYASTSSSSSFSSSLGGSGGTTQIPTLAADEYTILCVPHFAFVPDYVQSLRTLLDTLKDVYGRLLSFLVQTSVIAKDLGTPVLDSFQKFDARMRKLLATVYREIDVIARDKMTREMDSLLNLLNG